MENEKRNAEKELLSEIPNETTSLIKEFMFHYKMEKLKGKKRSEREKKRGGRL